MKEKLVMAQLITTLDWTPGFELMYDASDYKIGVVLGQRKIKVFHAIY